MIKYNLRVIIAAFVFGCISCGDDKEQNAKTDAQKQSPKYPVVTVPEKTVTSFTSYPTQITGVVNSEVRPKISGYITEVLVDEGEKVKKGQTLFRLETQSLDQDAQAAKANVNAAQVEVDKLQPLVAKNIIGKVQLETAIARLQQAKSTYNSILANIEYGNIKSPVDGYVGQIRLRKGALVNPNSQMVLTTVTDISNVYAYFSINEKDYLDFMQNVLGNTKREKIQNLPPVKLMLANGTEYEHEGKIEAINSQINSQTGSISLRATFTNAEGLLTNGSSGTIKVPHTYSNAIVVPQQSTQEMQDKILIYKVGKDSVAKSSVIKIKDAAGALFIIQEGVDKGDLIVAKGAENLKRATKIAPQSIPFDSVAKPIKPEFK